MRDFRIVQAKVLLNVYSVVPIRGFQPPSIAVIGDKMNLAKEVLYNGIQAPEFSISAPNRLVVKLPVSQVGKALNELQVISSTALTKASAAISFGLGKPPQTLLGMDRLVQSWIMIFFSTPGSDMFNKSSGGGAKALVGRVTNKSGKNVAADLAQAVERTRTELLRVQGLNLKIPPSERLLSSEISSIQFDDRNTILSGRVELRNAVGQRAEVTVA